MQHFRPTLAAMPPEPLQPPAKSKRRKAPVTEKRPDGLSALEAQWIQGVVQGQSLVDALGTRYLGRSPRRRQIRAAAMVKNDRVFAVLLERLHLAGNLPLAKELVAWRALQNLAKVVAKGDDLDASLKALSVLKGARGEKPPARPTNIPAPKQRAIVTPAAPVRPPVDIPPPQIRAPAAPPNQAPGLAPRPGAQEPSDPPPGAAS